MKFLLYPLSLIYRLVCHLKSLAYQRRMVQAKKAPIPVVSVGNISFGGSEKTPLSMILIASLLEQGYKPALISRGYRGRWEKEGGILSDGHSLLGSWQDSGDEPFMIAQNFKQTGIFVGQNRLSSCQKAKDSGFNVAVLDDGFQHLRLHRDIDIVMFNPEERITLRESMSSLQRSHIILTKSGDETPIQEKLRRRFPQTSIYSYSVISKGLFPQDSDQSAPVEALRDKKILAFCGIASPQRFKALLEDNGMIPLAFLKFNDHHPYPPSSLNKIINTYENIGAEAAITTEKDAVKLSDKKDLEPIRLFYLKIGLNIEPEFYSTLFSLLKNRDT